MDGCWFRDGVRSLRIDGGAGVVELAQGLLGVIPGKRYRLVFMVRANGLTASDAETGAAVLVLGKGVLAMTRPVFTGTFDWSRQILEFTAPAKGQAVMARISCRHPAGTVWFDGFRLEQISGKP